MKKTATTLLLFTLCITMASCQNKQKVRGDIDQFEKEINQWMAPFHNERKDEMQQWLELMETSPQEVRKHPVYLYMQQFYKVNESRYHQFRLEDLRRHQPAPKEFPDYEIVDKKYFEKEFNEGEVPLEEAIALTQDMYSIRAVNVYSTVSFVGLFSGSLLQYLESEKEKTMIEISEGYSFGYKWFADQIDDSRWEITVLNRIFMQKYTWNYKTNEITFINAFVYTGDGQKSGWLSDSTLKAYTPTEKLLQKVRIFKWSLYDEAPLSLRESFFEKKSEAFLQNHRNEYTAVRRENLSKQPSPDAQKWADFKQIDKEMTDDYFFQLGIHRRFDNTVLSATLSLYEMGGYSETVALFESLVARKGYMNDSYTPYYYITPWLVGNTIYAQEIEDDLWQIECFAGNFALKYRWNIATDELSNVAVYRKRE